MKKQKILSGILALMTLLVFGLACDQYGTKLEYNGGELYYTDDVTKEDADKLGKYLVEKEYFDGQKKSVQLDKEGGIYQVKMVIQKEKQEDKEVLDAMKIFAGQISEDVFGGAATEIHVADDKLETVRVVKQ